MKQSTIIRTVNAAGIRRILCWMLALVLLATCNMPSLALAATGEGSLQAAELSTQSELATQADGDTFPATEDGIGSNTEFTITTLTDFENFAKAVNGTEPYTTNHTFAGCTVTLASDIDMSTVYGEAMGKSWTPIGVYGSGTTAKPFRGTFDGASHQVQGLYINDSTLSNQGLFGYVTDGAVIKNLVVDGSVSAKQYIGGFVGRVAANTADVTLSNCGNKVQVACANTSAYSGGLIGRADGKKDAASVVISGCYNKGSISALANGAYKYIGGLVGSCTYTALSDCYNVGSLSSGYETTSIAAYIGGICGSATNTCSLVSCHNSGIITLGADIDAMRGCGALVGAGTSNASCSACYYMDGSASYALGLATASGGSDEGATKVSDLNTTTVVAGLGSQAWRLGTELDPAQNSPILAWEAPASSSPVTYELTADTAISNGAISLSASSAEAGTEITVTATPAIGYKLDAISVTDANGAAVAVADGKFTMPASNVTVSATFAVDESLANTSKVVTARALTSADAIEDGAVYLFSAPDDTVNAVMGTDGATAAMLSGAIDAAKGSISFDDYFGALQSAWTAHVSGDNITFAAANGQGLKLSIQYGAQIVGSDEATALVWKNVGLRTAAAEQNTGSEYTSIYGWLAYVSDSFRMTGADSATAPATKVKVWKVVPGYIVKFIDEDGTVLSEAVYAEGTEAANVEAPADPTKAATDEYTYTFAGWDSAIADVTADATYKATYASSKNKYSVTFDSDGGTAVAAQVIEYGGKASTPIAPTKDGYSFKGWQLNGTSYDFAAAVTSAITLKAVWEQNNSAAGDSGSASGSATSEASTDSSTGSGSQYAGKGDSTSGANASANSGSSAPASDNAKGDTTPTASSSSSSSSSSSGSSGSSSSSSSAGSGSAAAAATSIAKATVANKVYTGKALSPVVKLSGKTLKKGTDYTVSFKNAKGKAVKASAVRAAGTYKVTITGKGAYAGSVTKTFKIAKAKNTMTAKAKSSTLTVKYSSLKKKAQAITKSKAYKISKAKGKVTFNKKSGNKKITVNKKTGKVTVKKGLKKGTYKVKVNVKAAGTSNYKALTKSVTLKIKVK